MQDRNETETPDELFDRIRQEMDEAFARLRRPLDIEGLRLRPRAEPEDSAPENPGSGREEAA